MNAQRRKEIKKIAEKLEALKYDLEDVVDGEHNAYNNIPENLQWSNNGWVMSFGIERLDDAVDTLTAIYTDLYEFVYNH